MKLAYYDLTSEPPGFTWFNQPQDFEFGDGLSFTSSPRTDFWQRTHYGFRKDDGHAFLNRVSGDFTFTTATRFRPKAKYDQCGVFVRVDAANWLKASIEFEGDAPSRLGSVATNLGYSDWASQEIGKSVTKMHYRVSRRESDLLVEWSREGDDWHEMRIAHMHGAADEVEVGVYACSPVGDGFTSIISFIEIGDCTWPAPEAG